MTQIIAEFCQNHNGDMEILAKMVEAASKAGATHGKMQTIFADSLTYRPQFEEGHQEDGIVMAVKRPYKSEYQRLKQLEISKENTIEFIKLCNENGLIPLTTCFSRAHANDIRHAGFKSVKVASYDCASFQLLRELGSIFDEVIVSTGATYDEEIRLASKILAKTKFSFLHCVTIYPTPLEQIHLARMEWLRQFTSSVGFSDHTLVSRDGVVASKAALALGADLIERHFTILKESETKDGPVSISPCHLTEISEFAALEINERVERMNREYPEWRVMIGNRLRKLSHQELLNRDYYRGRFASARGESENGLGMIFNWEEIPLK
jgi:N,N'-diacetyllegionaminate synthase